MPNSVYDPRWLTCQTDEGPVSALGFTLSRKSPNYTGKLDEAYLLQVLRTACGRYGTTLAYVMDTARCLRQNGIRDHRIERLVALARAHALATPDDVSRA